MLNNGVDVIRAHLGKGWHTADPIAPGDTANAPLLQRQRHELLGQKMIGQRWRHDRLDVTLLPQVQERRGTQHGFVAGRQEQAVATLASSSPPPPETLQKGGDARGRADLDDATEVADVDAELERPGGDDDAIRGLGEGRSACRLSSRLREECETNVSTPR